MNIDSRARLMGQLKFGGFCALTVITVYIFFELSQVFGLLMVPLVGRLGAHYLVHAAFDDLPYWFRKWLYRGWHGAYYEFDGRQLRIDDFDRDLGTMPLIVVQDLENLFRDKDRFRIRDALRPDEGLLAGLPSIPVDRAVRWARVIARTNNTQADRARNLAFYLERNFVEPREREKRLGAVKAFETE